MSGDVAELERQMDFAPAEWQQVTLGKVVRIVTDGISAADLAALPKVHHYSLPAFDEGAGPEVGPGDTIKSNKTVVPDDCVLFSKLNPRIPRIWRVRGDAPPHSYCSTEFWPLVAQGRDVDLDYLTHYLSSAAFLGHPDITPSSSTNSHQRVDRKAFERFEFVLPPLDEQRRIAEVLRSVDEAIAAASLVIAQAGEAFEAVLADLFSCYGDASAKLESYCLSGGLQTGPFGSQLKAEDYVDEGIPVVMPVDLTPKGMDFEAAKKAPVAKSRELARHILQPGDVLFARRGEIGRCGLYLEGDPVAMCGTGCLRARLDTAKIDPALAYFLIQSRQARDWLRAHAVGATMPNLNTTIIGELPMPDIPKAEQGAWVDALLMIEGTRRINQSTLASYQIAKSTLMADLLSGRVGVPA